MNNYIPHQVDIVHSGNFPTVRDLINALKQVPQDMPVLISVMDGTEPRSIYWDELDGEPQWHILIC